MNESQQTFVASGGAPTQTDKLIEVLHAADGQWVGLPQLVEAVGAFAIHSRAADARKMGVNIENRVTFDPATRKRFSWYRLLAP